MSKQTSNKTIAKNTLFLYFRMILILFVSLYTTRVVLNALGVIDYGINNAVASVVTMFMFLNTSMANGIQRFYNYTMGNSSNHNLTEVYNTALQIQAIISVILILLLETVGLWYMHNQMVIPAERFDTALWVYQFTALTIILIVMQAPYTSAIMAHEKMDTFAYISIFEVLAKLAVAYLISTSGGDRLFEYSLLNLLVAFIIFIIYFAYSKYNFKELKIKFQFHKHLFKPMLSFSGWNIFGSFAYVLKAQGVNLLLNSFFGPIVNSARGVSGMIMTALQGFQSNVVIAFRPQIIKSYAQHDYERVRQLMYSLSKLSFLMLATLSIPIIIEIDYILKLWLGEIIPDYTKSFTILILANMMIASLTAPLSQVVHATGNMRNFQVATSAIVCMIIPVSWIFLKLGYDPNSVYIVSLIVTIINQIVCNYMLKRIFPYSIKEYTKAVILPSILLTIIVLGITELTKSLIQESFVRLIVSAAVAVISSVITAYLILLNKQERGLIKKIIKKR